MKPDSLSEVVGQDHLLNADGPPGAGLGFGPLPSFILWELPGTGKTTIARLVARDSEHEFVQVSVAHSKTAEIRRTFEAARNRLNEGVGTILFVDEIHRFCMAWQDGFPCLMPTTGSCRAHGPGR